MERYSEYKDSGVQWLGVIPGHWKTMRLGLLGECSNGVSKGGDYFGEGYPFVSYSDVYKNIELPQKVEGLAKSTEDDRQKYSVEYGDVFFTRTSETIQEIGFSSTCLKTIPNAVFAGFLIRFRPTTKELIPEYSKYYFRCNNLRSFYITRMNLVTRASLSQSLLRQLTVTLPPLSEQHSIVSYLDDKCGKIDKMLEGKQKQIELLAEMKQRIIADAVTHGLNPDVKMKATNIPWLPEIPEHWDVNRGKNLFNKEQRPIEEGDDIVTCFRDGEVTLRKNRRTTGFTEATDYSHYQHICKGDLVIHQMDAFAGSSGVSDSDGMGTPVLSVCTAKIGGLNHYYYAYILRLMGKNNFILSLYRGIRERSSDFRFETFAKQYLPVPPALEQEQIVNFINERSSKIDALTGKLQKEIESIKEYKQRLISDVVTGQIKVC
jgi:type I restriction enzyme S subunit